MKTKFIPQISNNNTIKLFDALTGQLYRIVSVTGTIVSQPICSEDELYVTVEEGGNKVIKFYSLPYGSLVRIQPI
jgi:hypothetical protein